MTALGIVFGDIGTSPLYAMRECFHHAGPASIKPEHVLGVLSLIFWALTLIISLKYLLFVTRADNRGEGGVLALMALASAKIPGSPKLRGAVVLVGLAGAALLYGDGAITPAISVLSAVEGLGVATPAFERWVEPITILVLVGVFLLQRRGTDGIGVLFGPITLAWFLLLAVLGCAQLIERPDVLAALNPRYGYDYLVDHKLAGFLALGSVFLVVTGGEALYADMGHVGIRPIRAVWFAFVGPALILNYFGQGALLLSDPSAAENPFYRMVPSWALYPTVALATAATIIASQAVISGAFSLTRQATMLGYWPRVTIRHTSAHEIGQIYVPSINWLLMAATIGLVIGFDSSTSLAAAYGIAVTATMVITTLLAFVVARYRWGWPAPIAVGITLVLLVVDLAFFGANIVKFADGGWFPIAAGLLVFLLMATWKKGRAVLARRAVEQLVPLEDFFEVMRIELPARVPGTAIFMTSTPAGTPPALIHNFQHNRVVHEQVLLLTVVTEESSNVAEKDRVTVERLDHGFTRLIARYGFMETPDIPKLLARSDVPAHIPSHTTFFLGRETLLAEGKHGLMPWRGRLFAAMARNAIQATVFFRVPADRVMEVGAQVEL